MSEDKKRPALFDTVIHIDDEAFKALTVEVKKKQALRDALMRSVDPIPPEKTD